MWYGRVYVGQSRWPGHSAGLERLLLGGNGSDQFMSSAGRCQYVTVTYITLEIWRVRKIYGEG